ncbi:hypothetical protein C8F04DRAFT_1388735 [Mycena alexandri]|uniref:Uncharacterized protein n=1 Tax=Mycena alexandri TaxID=1745969 RepID=A0AAD6XCR4_9AGAR|nr:hypothetical protein C8F04DRAFT_1388735 [Mycena alexandri]
MSMTFRKDRVRVVAIHTIPGTSSDNFQQQVGGTLENFLKLPVVQKNALKLELSLANGGFDQTAQALGLQKSQLNSMVMIEAESIDNLNEIVRDSAFQKIFQGVTQVDNVFNINTSVVFSADVMTCIDK